MSKHIALLASLLCLFLFSTCGAESIIDDIKTYEIELPINLSGTTSNWRIWGTNLLSTRLFTGMDSDKNVYIGCSSSENNAYVFKVNPKKSKILKEHEFPGYHVRGLYVHKDGSYGVLLWDPVKYNISVAKINKKNKEVWHSELYHNYAVPDDFGIGDSRLEYGNGEYRAYYHVHGVSDFAAGHEGDAYYSIDDNGNIKCLWSWGCSHSMSNLLRYHPDTNATLAICDSDAYPGHGIYTEDRNPIYGAPGNERGCTAAELGGVEIGDNGTWLLVFNGPQPERSDSTYNRSKDNQDIGLAFIGSDKKKISVKFLTTTADINEADSCIGRLGSSSQYLVGWKSGNDYLLSIIDSEGNFVNEPVNVTEYTKWGARDDSFRSYNDGNIVWLYAPDNRGNKIVITKFTGSSYSNAFAPLVTLMLLLVVLL